MDLVESSKDETPENLVQKSRQESPSLTRQGIAGNFRIIEDCEVGEGTIIRDYCHLIQCKIGRHCKIGSFVEIQKGVVIGDLCKIEPFAFIPQGVTIAPEVFIGPHVCFTNDKHPKAVGDWTMLKTFVATAASIGAGAIILPGIRIGAFSRVAAGAVVTKDVPDGALAVGNPAKITGGFY